MIISNSKIKLRAIEDTDVELLHTLINDEEIESMTGGTSFPVSRYKQEQWIKSQQLSNDDTILRVIIEDNATNQAVGTLILSDIDYKNANAEIHIKLLGKFQGNGYATSSIKLMEKYACETLRLHAVYANILRKNIPSINLFEKNNYKLDGFLKDRVFKSGQFQDVASYTKILGE